MNNRCASLRQSVFAMLLLLLFLAPFVARAQKPELNVQIGHNKTVNSIVYSRDSKLMASASEDSTVKLWDAVTGTQLRTISTAESNRLSSFAMSPDGKSLAIAGVLDIRFVDVVSGAQVGATIKAEKMEWVVFSSDGKTLAGAEYFGNVKIWNVASGEEVRAFNVEGGDKDNRIAFSPDGKSLASASGQKILMWDVASGNLLRTLEGHTDEVTAIAFSHDGKIVASGSGTSDKTIRLWDAATGQLRHTLKEETDGAAIQAVAFSFDDRKLVSAVDDQYGRPISIWNAVDGTQITRPELTLGSVRALAYSPDGKQLAIGGSQLMLWNASTNTELRDLSSRTSTINNISFDKNSRALVSLMWNTNEAKFWDVASGGALRTLPLNTEYVPSSSFSADGRFISEALKDSTIKIKESSTGKEIRKLAGHSERTEATSFSPDGKLLASSSADYKIKLWSLVTGKEFRSIADGANWVYNPTFSPDNRLMAYVEGVIADGDARKGKQLLILANAATGATVRTLPTSSVDTFAFTPDGKLLAIGGGDDVVLWNVADGTEIRTLKGHTNKMMRLAFSSNGKLLASASADNTIKIWDVTSGANLQTLKGHTDLIEAVAFSPDNLTLVSGGRDTQIKLWDVKTGAPLADLIAVNNNDWLIVTPDGLFDGTPPAWKQILWRFNNNTFDYTPVETFFTDFYYPGLLAEIVEGKRPRAAGDISQKDRRQPKINLTLADSVAPTATKPSVNVKISLTDSAADASHTNGSGAQDVRLFRNGSLVKVWHGDALKGGSNATLEATIPVVAGDNQLTAYVFNRDNVKSADATLAVKGAESLRRKGVAYVLAVGVNTYANHDFDLKYAVADAQDFSGEWKAQQTKLKTFARTEVTMLTDAAATKPAILKFLNDLAAKAKPEDAVVIYFAGHGTAQLNRFYLIPHDLGYAGGRDAIDDDGIKTILANSVSDLELQEAVERIDAGQLLMVIDACNSGQALESEEKRRGPMNSKGLAQLAYEKGMYILTAAQSYQAAQEASRLGHGFLTFALVEEGIKQSKADDGTKDGQIIVREWFDYATQRVPQMQVELMKEAQGGRGVKVAFVQGEEKVVDPEQRNVQRPRVFYRREIEAQPLVVARPQ